MLLKLLMSSYDLEIWHQNCWHKFRTKISTKPRNSQRILKPPALTRYGPTGLSNWLLSHYSDFPQSVCGCTTALASAPEGSCIWDVSTGRSQLLLCPSQSSPQQCWMPLWLQSCPGRAVWWAWLSSEGHSPPPGCRWCSCSQGHFRSSFSLQTCSLSRQPLESLWKTSASHSPCKEHRHPERSLALHRVKADGAEATAEFWSCISITSRNNSVSPSATSSFCVFLL